VRVVEYEITDRALRQRHSLPAADHDP
jgi:hypothetical protein